MDDETQLIRRVIARQPEAEEEFVRRYSGLVLGLARGRFGLVGGAAEDILQATMEKLWRDDCRALRAWRGRGRFASYLTVIVTHHCLRQRQTLERRQEEAMAPAELARVAAGSQPVAAVPTADAALISRERRRHVDEELGQLPARDRLLLALRFADGRSPKEIAAVTGQASGTVRKAIHDALRRLRRRLVARRPELFEAPVAEVRRPADTAPRHRSCQIR